MSPPGLSALYLSPASGHAADHDTLTAIQRRWADYKAAERDYQDARRATRAARAGLDDARKALDRALAETQPGARPLYDLAEENHAEALAVDGKREGAAPASLPGGGAAAGRHRRPAGTAQGECQGDGHIAPEPPPAPAEEGSRAGASVTNPPVAQVSGPPAEAPFAFPGDVVRTSYGTGPYVVHSIRETGQRDGRPTYSMVLYDPGEGAGAKKRGNASYLNYYQRQADGRILAENGDELVVLPAGTDGGPTHHAWMAAAGLLGRNGDKHLQRLWMLGEAAPATSPDGPESHCHRCGSAGGAQVEMPSQADADDDLIAADMINCDLLTAVGIPADDTAANYRLCGKCHGELLEKGHGGKRPKAKARQGRKAKAPPIPPDGPQSPLAPVAYTAPDGTTIRTMLNGESRPATCSVERCRKPAVIQINTPVDGNPGIVTSTWLCERHRHKAPAMPVAGKCVSCPDVIAGGPKGDGRCAECVRAEEGHLAGINTPERVREYLEAALGLYPLGAPRWDDRYLNRDRREKLLAAAGDDVSLLEAVAGVFHPGEFTERAVGSYGYRTVGAPCPMFAVGREGDDYWLEGKTLLAEVRGALGLSASPQALPSVEDLEAVAGHEPGPVLRIGGRVRLRGQPERQGTLASISNRMEAAAFIHDHFCPDGTRTATQDEVAACRERVLAPAPTAGVCRVCGCTSDNCRRCVERTGEPCSWASPAKDLCSGCLPIVNAELTALPGLPVDLVDLVEASTYRHVGEVLRASDAQLVKDFSVSVNARASLKAAVADWVKARLAEAPDGDPIVSEADVPPGDGRPGPACVRCGGAGNGVLPELTAALELTDQDLLVPLGACPGTLAAAFRRDAGSAGETVPEGSHLCVGCLVTIQEGLPRKRKKARAT